MVTDTEVLEASILIVDDHQINVRLLERMLKNAGYFDVSGTSNPHDVLGLCRTLQPDLVLLDLFMPGIDGFHIMEKMKKGGRTSDPSVLVLTALNSPDVRARALHAGATDFMTKPFDRHELLEHVKSTLKARLMAKRTAAIG